MGWFGKAIEWVKALPRWTMIPLIAGGLAMIAKLFFGRRPGANPGGFSGPTISPKEGEERKSKLREDLAAKLKDLREEEKEILERIEKKFGGVPK